jgi:hypothetical protein
MSRPARPGSPAKTLVAAYALALAVAACSGNGDDDGQNHSAGDAHTDGGSGGGGSGDDDGQSHSAGPTCTAGLYGAPNERTGLSEGLCGPTCHDCAQPFTAPVIDSDDLDAMRAWTCETTFDVPSGDPYEDEAPAAPGADAVCAVRFVSAAGEPPRYVLQTYESSALATADGASPTHTGGCGACSTLSNFAVYAGTKDLTQPVRQCGLDHLDLPGNIACLEALGFDTPCATIWARNTQHTRKACLAPCLAALEQPYHLPDGSLNDCLQCDEDESGPVFKAVAGRTRRNSGLASALCRPCDDVRPIDHRAYLDGAP